MRIQHLLTSTAAALVVSAAFAGGAAQAQGNQVLTPPSGIQSQAATLAYWTPARLSSAQPKLPPAANGQAAPVAPLGAPQSAPGYKPSVEPRPVNSGPLASLASSSDVTPASRGTSGLPFTTSRVFPDAAVTTYPHSIVGKLFFSDRGSNFVCSASVLRQRLVVTAAHCVYNNAAGAKRFHTNFLFIPAHNGVSNFAPFGQWTVSVPAVLTGWTGTTAFPNPFDFAILEMNDLAGRGRIGAHLGFFGWHTFQAVGNHVTQLGYPCNLDSCRRQIRNDAQTRGAASNTLAELGSNMFGGASGGPWVQDFGVQAAGQVITSTGPNRIVAVTSYKRTDDRQQLDGASVFNSGFVTLINFMCARRAGNCS